MHASYVRERGKGVYVYKGRGVGPKTRIELRTYLIEDLMVTLTPNGNNVFLMISRSIER